MELKDLVGLHKLSGVDMSNESIKAEWGDSFEDCQVINFILDRKTYTAIEDPSDGYRSSMQEVKESKVVVKNKFAPVKVMGVMRPDNSDDVIDFFDVKTGKIVLSVGTDDLDDYYPSFVAEFTPENMAINTTA
jgi:hypothetical protein